jgi:hypothetical protein
MTEQERIELLKRVVEVAPKEMGAELVQFPIEYECEGVPGVDWDVRHVKFTKCEHTTFDGRLGKQSPKLYLDGSIDDAAPCFAMLDAMEKAQDWMLSTHVEDGVRRYCVWKDWDDDYPAISGAASRAEAIARAFISCFSEDGS